LPLPLTMYLPPGPMATNLTVRLWPCSVALQLN
jgi:hypothetical protein